MTKTKKVLNAQDLLKAKISGKTAQLAVIGLGYVGLPLAVEFAKAGFTVTGIDISKKKVDDLNAGKNYIQDVDTAELAQLVESGRLRATNDYAAIKKVDCISVCVPTPLSKTGDPDISFMLEARDAILPFLRPGTLFVLESTTYPGSTHELLVNPLNDRGFQVGKDVFVAFSPERVDPGNPMYKTSNTPKVIGGATKTCTALACELYASVMDTVIPVSSCTAAEMTKLLENTFRSINIGLVNEIAIMCKFLDVDVWEVIRAASTKPFGYMPFYPGPGLGGHCIPIDPLYLSWKLKTLDYKARFIELADEVNSSMPDQVITLVSDALNTRKKSINGSRILLLGIAYKKDIDDLRESPALTIYERLKKRGARLLFHDPYIPSFRTDDGVMTSVKLTTRLLKSVDCVVIVTDHSSIDYRAVVTHASLVVDTRNATSGIKNKKIIKL